jgi:hypothetical protein
VRTEGQRDVRKLVQVLLGDTHAVVLEVTESQDCQELTTED